MGGTCGSYMCKIYIVCKGGLINGSGGSFLHRNKIMLQMYLAINIELFQTLKIITYELNDLGWSFS